MPRQKNTKDDSSAKPKAALKVIPNVVVHGQPMNEGQTQRLYAAVDALLTELVRQQIGRGKQS